MELFWLVREHAWRELGKHLAVLLIAGALLLLVALAFLDVAPGSPRPKNTMCSDVGGLPDDSPVLDECAPR